MYEVSSKLLNGIKSTYVNSIARVRLKGGENEGFRINNGMRKSCIMFTRLFNVYIDTVMKEVKLEVIFLKEGEEWRC